MDRDGDRRQESRTKKCRAKNPTLLRLSQGIEASWWFRHHRTGRIVRSRTGRPIPMWVKIAH